MDQLTTDGIIKRLRALPVASRWNADAIEAAVQSLVDDIIETRNRDGLTKKLIAAFAALKKFDRGIMSNEVRRACEGLAELLNSEVFLGPAGKADTFVGAFVGPSAGNAVRFPWEYRLHAWDGEIIDALTALRRSHSVHPNREHVENHTRFVVDRNSLGEPDLFYVDIHDSYVERFTIMVNKQLGYSAKPFKVESAPGLAEALKGQVERTRREDPTYMAEIHAKAVAACTGSAPWEKALAAADNLDRLTKEQAAHDQLIATYRIIFRVYLRSELEECVRLSGPTVADGQAAYQRAVKRLRTSHAGVTDAEQAEICEGELSLDTFLDQVSKAVCKKVTPQIIRNIFDGPKLNEVKAPSGRPGDLLVTSGTGNLMWRSPDSDGRIDPTIFGAVRPDRI